MSVQVKKASLLRTSVLLVLMAAILVPALAWAVPGSGDFVSLHSGSGREMTDLYNVLAKICLVVLLIVEGILIFAIIRFRRRSDDERPVQNHGNLKLEAAWTLAVIVIQVYIGWITIDVMWKIEVMPENVDITIEAIAYQWDWQFRYPEQDNLVSDDLVIPAHANVKLEVTSRDVLHAIFVPDLGVKIDAVPGRFNYWWVNADGPVNQVRVPNYSTIGPIAQPLRSTRPDFMQTRPDATQRVVTGLEQQVDFLGFSRRVEEVSPYAKYSAVEYQGVCAELCGKGHWDMYFRTVVMTRSSFDQWVHDQQTGVREVDGPAIYGARCASCHGATGVGEGAAFPSLVGAERVVDANLSDTHISIILSGQGVMPPFGGVLNDAEVAAVVNHERMSWGNDGGAVTADEVAAVRQSLGLAAFPAGGVEPIPSGELSAEGERIYQSCVTCHGADGRGPDFIPNLAANSTVLGEPARLVDILVNGQDTDRWPGSKTPVGRSMTDHQLAAVLTYIRTSWDNEAEAVQPHDVGRLRREVRR